MNDREYMNLAREACKNSHSPYSNFKVGACLVTSDNKYYTGCNIENHGIQGICAERCAFSKAISSGEKSFSKIYVTATSDLKNYVEAMPCGYCRQFMSEFVNDDFKVYIEKDGEIKEYVMKDLLPYSFKF